MNSNIVLNTPPFYSRMPSPFLFEVRRARGYYLYCQDGRRIFDMYLANGRLVYGHKPFQISQRAKQAIDQGLLSDVPHIYTKRLLQMCAQMFSQYRYVYLFPSIASINRALPRHLSSVMRSKRIADPAYTTQARQTTRHPLIAYHRINLPTPNATILVPLIPSPHLTGVQPVWSNIKMNGSARLTCASAFDTLAIMYIIDGIKKEKEVGYSRKRTDIIDPLTHTHHHRLKHWRANGTYLHSTLKKKEYSALFAALLQGGILVNPAPHGITLLPPQMPKKEYFRFIEINTAFQSRKMSTTQ